MTASIKELSHQLISKVKQYNNELDENLLQHALDFGTEAHKNQKRKSGEPYFTHPIEVAIILADYNLDTDSIITALLHDTVEDTEVTLKDLEKHYGKNVAKLVDGVTKLTQLELKHSKQSENFRKLLVATADDLRVLLIKLADRLHNMQTIQHFTNYDKKLRIANETMDIYAPLAERIGMQKIKDELQDLSFQVLYPDVRQSIINRLDYLKSKGQVQVDNILTELQTHMNAAKIKNAKVVGREKRPCSIWNKMKRKNVGFEQLSDIFAFRVFVDKPEHCYKALGIIHTKYHAIGEHFRDYISTPKPNGYQSLHTTIMGPQKQVIEVQIRTYKMHEVAENGFAAHWSYKQNREISKDGKQYRWIRDVMDILGHSENPEEFLENTKMSMYHDQVFCFTPRGDLIPLIKGSTPVDFAYAVHSDVGRTCVGAKVNGSVVPLRRVLDNGDQVDILTSSEATPNPIWDNFVATGKAKSEIRKYIRSSQNTQYISLGKSILSKYFKSKGKVLRKNDISTIIDKFNLKDEEELNLQIGNGTLDRAEVYNKIHPDGFGTTVLKALRFTKEQKKEQPIPIKGLVPGMAMHFNECCHPIPGDKIIGIMTAGKGVTIHTIDCETLENFTNTPERWLDVTWDTASKQSTFNGRIKVIIAHEKGTLAKLTNHLAAEDTDIKNLKITNRNHDFFEMILDIEVKDLNQLNNAIASLRSLHIIHSVERMTH